MHICLGHESRIARRPQQTCEGGAWSSASNLSLSSELSRDGIALDTMLLVPKDTSYIAHSDYLLTRFIGSFRIDRDCLLLCKGCLKRATQAYCEKKTKRLEYPGYGVKTTGRISAGTSILP
jgi:hypothetical protein